ncbi:LptF/LptG family permease [Candidatus Omnitrophota bacterium]
MRILDRYIFRSALNLFIGCLLVFLFLYIIIDIFSHLDEILKQQVDLQTLLRYYLGYIPIIFVQVAPVACLLATLYTFGRMNHNNEIIAMRSSGLSIFQITKTIIIFGIVVSVLTFWVNDKFVPSSLQLTEEIKEQMEAGKKRKKAKKEERVVDNLCIYGLKNRLFYINKFYVDSERMEGVIVLEHDQEQNITKKVVANKGVYKEGLWRFYQSITYDFDSNGQVIGEPWYLEEEIMAIPETPRDFINQRQRPDFMTINELDDYIWKLSKSGALTVIRNLKVDLYHRFTSPFTSAIIILLGIPFALKMKKRATGLSSVGIAMFVGFVYYVFSAVGIALGKSGILFPALSASLSHILALSASIYLIHSLP